MTTADLPIRSAGDWRSCDPRRRACGETVVGDRAPNGPFRGVARQDRSGRWVAARTLGIVIGDRVVISSGDDAETSLLFVALVCNGITVVNLDPDTSADRAQSLIRRADPRLLLLDRGIAAKWSVAGLPGKLIEIVAPTTSSRKFLGKFLGKTAPVEGLHAQLAAVQPQSPPSAIDGETLAYILFTSGTTAQPKGVASAIAPCSRIWPRSAAGTVTTHPAASSTR